MAHQTSLDDHKFRKQFETCAISTAEFDHRAHVRLAYIYLCEAEPELVYSKMRNSLQVFLSHHGVDPAKYHETLTRAWMMAIHYFMLRSNDMLSASGFIDGNPEILQPEIMLSHYSKEKLFSEKARSTYLEADIEPIPTRAHSGEVK